jgi:aspartate aminotransferase-like enzyme
MDILRDEHGIMVAAGQQELRQRVLRVSPMGKSPEEIRGFAEALGAALARMGRSLPLAEIWPEVERTLEDSKLWESLRS